MSEPYTQTYTSHDDLARRLLANPTAGYTPASMTGYVGLASASLDGKPLFTWIDVPRMVRDPQVRLVERMWRAPFRLVTWTVKAEDPRIARFVDATLRRFWTRSLPKMLSHFFRWGYTPGGAEFKTHRGRIRLDRVRAIEPMDATPRVWKGGPRDKQFAGFYARDLKVLVPHAMWFAGNGELGPYHDFPPLAGMFNPWLEKNSRNGATDQRVLHFRKNASRGDVIRFPDEVIPLGPKENTRKVHAGDLARQIANTLETGSTCIMSSERWPNTDHYKWDLQPPQATGQGTGQSFLDYVSQLDREQTRGAGIPDEVLEAAKTGSGWSGRTVPLMNFFGGVDETAGGIIESADAWMKYAVAANYSKDAWYEIEPHSLVQKILDDGQGGGEGGGGGGDPGAAVQNAMNPDGPPAGQPAAGGAGAGGRSKKVAGGWGGQLSDGRAATGGNGGGSPIPAEIRKRVRKILRERDRQAATNPTLLADGRSGAHAPTGGVNINGLFFRGGEFIPGKAIANATPEVRAKILGGQPKPQPSPSPAAGQPPRKPPTATATAAPAAPQPAPQSSPQPARPQPPADQADILSRVQRAYHDADMNDPMGHGTFVDIYGRMDKAAVPPEARAQFDAHGTSLQGLAHILNHGLDPNRQFYSERLDSSDPAARLLRDTPGNVLALGHPGKSIKEGGVGGVIVPEHYAPHVKHLERAFPGVKFIPASKAADALKKVAMPGGAAVEYGNRPQQPRTLSDGRAEDGSGWEGVELADGRGQPGPGGIDPHKLILAAMLRTQERCTARGRPAASEPYLRHLADLAADPDRLRDAMASASGGSPLELSWIPYEGPRHGRGWKNTETGRVRYGGEHAPGEARKKQQASASRARELTDLVMTGEATPDHLQELQDHLPALNVDQLRNARNRMGVELGGRRKREQLVNHLLDHVRGLVAEERANPGAMKARREKELADRDQPKPAKVKKPPATPPTPPAPPTAAPVPSVYDGKPADPRPDGTPKTAAPGTVYKIPVSSLKVDPERFQYKLGTNTKGVTDQFKDTKVFNPDLAGVLMAWRDPETGQDHVVNGHHRYELADRTGHPDVNVMYSKAKTVEEARAAGALANIAEGRGTAVDAAKFLRDTKLTPAESEAKGVNLRENIARDANTLLHLSDANFSKLTRGQIELPAALAVARHVTDPERQDKLFKKLQEREDDGKGTSPKHMEEMARQMAAVPNVSTTTSTLWGDETSDEDVFDERAELAAAARADLAREVNDFAAGSSERRAEKLGEHGNKLDVATNQKLKEQADRAKNLYDLLAHRKGPISEALNAGAVELKKAKSRKEKENVRTRVTAAVRSAIAGEYARLDNKQPVGEQSVGAVAGAEGAGAGGREADDRDGAAVQGGAGQEVSPPAVPNPTSEPAPAPEPAKSTPPASDPSTVVRRAIGDAIKSGKYRGQGLGVGPSHRVPIKVLRDALAKAGVGDRKAQDEAIYEATWRDPEGKKHNRLEHSMFSGHPEELAGFLEHGLQGVGNTKYGSVEVPEEHAGHWTGETSAPDPFSHATADYAAAIPPRAAEAIQMARDNASGDPKHLPAALASVWVGLHKTGATPEELAPVEAEMAKHGVKRIGAAGETHPFSGELHQVAADVPHPKERVGAAAVNTGEPVTVDRPGWVQDHADGVRTRLVPAVVRPASRIVDRRGAATRRGLIDRPATTNNLETATATVKGLHGRATDQSITPEDLRKQTVAAIAGLSKDDLEKLVAAIGYKAKPATKEAATKVIINHVVGRRGAFDRADA